MLIPRRQPALSAFNLARLRGNRSQFVGTVDAPRGGAHPRDRGRGGSTACSAGKRLQDRWRSCSARLAASRRRRVPLFPSADGRGRAHPGLHRRNGNMVSFTGRRHGFSRGQSAMQFGVPKPPFPLLLDKCLTRPAALLENPFPAPAGMNRVALSRSPGAPAAPPHPRGGTVTRPAARGRGSAAVPARVEAPRRSHTPAPRPLLELRRRFDLVVPRLAPRLRGIASTRSTY